MKKITLAILAINAVVAVVATARPNPILPVRVPELEKVKVLEITQTANLMPGPGPRGRSINTRIEVEVMSNGCTGDKDFNLEVVNTVKGQSLKILRLHPDACEAVAHPVVIQFETGELNRGDLYSVYVVNPLPVTTHFVY